METLATPLLEEATGCRDVFLDLDLRRGQLRRNLRGAIREAIQDGRLATGTRLPSSRRLATDLRVSRGVVADTYDQLTAEGYLETQPRQAPLVAGVGAAPPLPDEPTRPTWAIDFIATTPDVELFPRRAWIRATERALRQAPNDALDYGDHRGRIELRRALSGYLGRVRGVRIEPERMVITQGFTQGLDLVSRVLRDRGATTIAFESPSQASGWGTPEAVGLRVEGVPVDADGVRTDLLGGVTSPAIVLTPAHQFPTGAVLAPERRAELVAWANRADRLIVEDDYDAEYRYDRNGIGAIQGLDPCRVIHIGTASKTLAPGIRLGWMSLPDEIVEEIRLAKGAQDSGSPAIEQLALAELISSGDYDRHVARARHVYRQRRDAVMTALAQHLPGLAPQGAAAGLHVLLRLPDDVDDVAIQAAAAERGIGVNPLSPMSRCGPPERGLVVGYSRLTVERIDGAVAALAACLADVGVASARRPRRRRPARTAAPPRHEPRFRPRPRSPTPGSSRARPG
jgi:GntR family transcriptional regulator/MocR family aminotransferase